MSVAVKVLSLIPCLFVQLPNLVRILASDHRHYIPNRLLLSDRARQDASLRLNKSGPDDQGASWEDLAYAIGNVYHATGCEIALFLWWYSIYRWYTIGEFDTASCSARYDIRSAVLEVDIKDRDK